MWFRLAINPFVPTLSILVEQNGLLYVKLVDIGTLLQKKNPYTFRTQMKFLAVLVSEVIPREAGFKIPAKTFTTHVVPLSVAYRLLLKENAQLGELLVQRLKHGFAQKQGMRKFVGNDLKSPLLVCVDQRDENCVSVPEWIDAFIKDLQLLRAAIRISSRPTSPEPGPSHVSPKRKHVQRDPENRKYPRMETNLERESVQEVAEEPTLASLVEPMATIPVQNAEPSTESLVEPMAPSPVQNAEISTESLVEPMATIPVQKAETSTESLVETPMPTIKVELEDSTESLGEQPVPTIPLNDVNVELEESALQMDENSNTSMETQPVPESEQPVAGPSTERSENARKSLHLAFINFPKLQFVPTVGQFPEPGDLIVKFCQPPQRIFFIQGEKDDLYWVCNKKKE